MVPSCMNIGLLFVLINRETVSLPSVQEQCLQSVAKLFINVTTLINFQWQGQLSNASEHLCIHNLYTVWGSVHKQKRCTFKKLFSMKNS